MSSSARKKKTILFLAANPKDSTPLRLGEEVKEIEEGLLRAEQRGKFQLKQEWAVRPRDMRRAILGLKPQIVHFSGHGAGAGGLALEDDAGKMKLVDTEALASLFALFKDQIECVVLNACYSEIQAAAIVRHIPYVIGMKQAVGDKAAQEFAIGFYDALGAGRSIDFAYEYGCTSIQFAGIPEQLTPVLKKKSDLSGAAASSVSIASELAEDARKLTPIPKRNCLSLMVKLPRLRSS
ncbi:MAG: CHAT domain-containing protein [Leptolyngbyaceae cyanobacterium SM1_3_5]|nr:CHAT domain-containing protein [Leptolyngbyaceae cyanobacterium SM1_3_5]